jgi:elongation factor Ts
VAEITAQDVQRLRQTAGVGMMDAKKALTEAGGDFDRAFELLRERGLAAAAKRAGREASDGPSASTSTVRTTGR